MRAPRNTVSVLSLAAASACLMIAGIGCKSDVEKADAKVSDIIAQGEASAGTPEAMASAVQKALDVKNASPAAQVNANVRLATAQAAQAGVLLSEIDRGDNRVAQLVAEISRSVDVIKGNSALQMAYQKSEPTSARKAIEDAKDAALGKADAIWVKHESGPVPSMSGVDKTIADTGAQIAAIEAKIKGFTDERTAAIADAERLGKDAEAASGRVSLDLFTKAENQRDVSRRDAIQVVDQQSKLKELKEDLDRAQAEKAILATAVAGFDTQLKGTQAGWNGTEAEIKQLRDLVVALLGSGAAAPAGGTPDASGTSDVVPEKPAPAETPAPAEEKKDDDTAKPGARLPSRVGNVRLVSADRILLAQLPPARRPASDSGASANSPKAAAPVSDDAAAASDVASTRPTIEPVSLDVSAKAAELSALVAELQVKRDKADELLKSAGDHYKAAADAAEAYSKKVLSISSKVQSHDLPERAGWDSLLDAYSPASFNLNMASVQLMTARLHQSAAEEMGMRGKMIALLQSATKDAGMSAPGDLNDAPLKITEGATAERDKASAAYAAADTLIADIEKATASYPSMTQAQQLARFLTIASYYGQGQLKGQTEPDKVKALVDQAVSEAKGKSESSGSGTAISLPAIIQDALGIREGTGGSLAGVATSGPTSGPTTESTTEPTTNPAGSSKVFGDAGDTTKPAAKPDDTAAPDKPEVPEKKSTDDDKPAAEKPDASTPAEAPDTK